MTRSFAVIGFLLGLFASGLIAQEPQVAAKASTSARPPMTVTYIGNEGFLIETAGRKVLIDALFDEGAPDYMTPTPELLGKIEAGKSPFADVDLILVTHIHGDHFSPAILLRYLRAHRRCHLVAHKQVIDAMRSDRSFHSIQKQIHELDLEVGARGQVGFAGITVDALCLKHGAPQREVRNLIFLTDLGGARFLHMGDTFFWDRENDVPLNAYPFEQAHVDLLFVNQYDRGPAKTRDFIAKRINPSHLVVMHIGPGEYATVSTKIYSSFPSATLFEKSMEQRIFK